MARLGVTRAKTGCITCKVRKVKCDEARPVCNRCVNTGRKCDGYAILPMGTYSWAQLLRPPPTKMAPYAEHRALAFFRTDVAPGLAGVFDSYFWTHLVTQISYEEPAVKHAALAISSLYENFNKDPLDRSCAKNFFAITHYNESIKHLRNTNNRERVLFVCVLFVCIEMLRGEYQSAIDHCRHGIEILNSIHFRSDFTKSHLEPAFCRLSVAPFCLGVRPDAFPNIASSHPAPTAPFDSLSDVQAALDPLLIRAIRFIRAADGYRLGDQSYPEPNAYTIEEREEINDLLDAWLIGFQAFKKRKAIQKCQLNAIREDIIKLLLKSRWLISKIWVQTCFSREEAIYDLHLDKFSDVIELVRQAEVILTLNKYPRSRFTVEMGFTPLLAFVLIKCRSLSLRIAAMRLMKALAHEKESLWDLSSFTAFATQVIKFEHGLQLGPGEDIVDVVDDGTLPSEKRRIKDTVMRYGTRIVPGDDGVTLWKKVDLLLREPKGPIAVKEEWYAVQLMQL
ncbi:C6 zinc finger domain-containing protein [Colletotrichum incanum]|nr:C6 zinc finger domain-containing protein [Colletotrichum incanum]